MYFVDCSNSRMNSSSFRIIKLTLLDNTKLETKKYEENYFTLFSRSCAGFLL